ncbi:hypothetical protein K438DRAFT_1824674 [Mycena galopus ATCC 62051]|nr:hypothetical protein K438DRAFT_1824674 [Mycena galopus ATCC 62051]
MSGKFIVVFKAAASQEKIDKCMATVKDEGGEIGQTFTDPGMRGFSATLSEATFTKFKLQANADADSPIDSIEADGVTTEAALFTL